MCGLWCGTYDAPDNLGKHFGDADIYPLLKDDLSLLDRAHSTIRKQGRVVFRGPRPSGRMVLNESYDPEEMNNHWLKSLGPRPNAHCLSPGAPQPQ